MKKKAKTCRDKLKNAAAGQKIAAKLSKEAYLKRLLSTALWWRLFYDGLGVKRNERVGN